MKKIIILLLLFGLSVQKISYETTKVVAENLPTCYAVEIETEDIEYEEAVNEIEESTYTEEDVELLARLVHGEARGEPYEGQVAVAAVVLNRMETTGYPNTMEGVIFEEAQFSCVTDGQFYIDIPQDSTVYQAARDALEGVDPTNGSLYFYNPDTSTNRWIFDNTETTVVIGNHRFAI